VQDTVLNDDINYFEGFFNYKKTPMFKWLINCKCRTILLVTGNQGGKNETAWMDYCYRILNIHPQKHKNITPDMKIRTIRFASEVLPADSNTSEVKNTQYPVIKRRFPSNLILKDLTARRHAIDLLCAAGGFITVEFVSYSQTVQEGAGVQRTSIYIDELCSQDFYEEQMPRLLASGGDVIITFTPVEGSNDWLFDKLFERARMVYRTEAVRKRIKERMKLDLPEVEINEKGEDVAVIMWATDDNPIYEGIAKRQSEIRGYEITAEQYIDEMFGGMDDETVDARRYGIFRQLSGKVHKQFDLRTHVIKPEDYFPSGIPEDYSHFRGIDYHQANAWAVVWGAVSKDNELFIYRDAAFKPGNLTTYDISGMIADMSGVYKYRLDLIDPLACTRQVNTNTTTVEDLNRYFRQFRLEGRGTGAYWQGWDTKGTRGREELTRRLINSIRVGKPFNNKVVDNGRTSLLPTVWFFDSCRPTIESLKNWRYDTWDSREALQRNEEKEKPAQKWSHFPMVIECVLKNPIIATPRFQDTHTDIKPKNYYKMSR
jgi:hypothetical protein